MKTATLSPTLPALERRSYAVPQIKPLSAEAIALPSKHTASELKPKRGATIFTSTFLTIFLAEMGDKTQLATLLMSAQSQSPWVVFAGAATALIATSIVGVLLGRWLATKLSPKTLNSAAAASLLFISLTLLWDVVRF